MVEERGQATVELLAAVPLLLIAGAISLQLLLVGYTLTLTDGAAETAALALAAGRPAKSAAHDSLPSWAAGKAEIAVRGGEVTVRLAPPSLLAAVADRLAVTSNSYARPTGQ